MSPSGNRTIRDLLRRAAKRARPEMVEHVAREVRRCHVVDLGLVVASESATGPLAMFDKPLEPSRCALEVFGLPTLVGAHEELQRRAREAGGLPASQTFYDRNMPERRLTIVQTGDLVRAYVEGEHAGLH